MLLNRKRSGKSNYSRNWWTNRAEGGNTWSWIHDYDLPQAKWFRTEYLLFLLFWLNFWRHITVFEISTTHCKNIMQWSFQQDLSSITVIKATLKHTNIFYSQSQERLAIFSSQIIYRKSIENSKQKFILQIHPSNNTPLLIFFWKSLILSSFFSASYVISSGVILNG